ncbi:Hypothetical predicted protein [Podarcis lilfordi]|uniref:Uncharacterized protein n=1 Tax=Podarcis lilfordi TaxID=74358 RepID=A0AA35L9C3_9SAUR|nr:Hypothetical predicted protein [Podarcis lilfordi]
MDLMDKETEDFKSKEKALDDAIERLKKENKFRKEKLVAFWQKKRELSKRTDGRNTILWERNMKLWKKVTDLFESIRNVLKEEPELWKEELDSWTAEMALWKKEMDQWEERFCGSY